MCVLFVHDLCEYLFKDFTVVNLGSDRAIVILAAIFILLLFVCHPGFSRVVDHQLSYLMDSKRIR
jgi:hypothetical protein